MQRARHLFRSSLAVILLFALDKVVGLLRTQLVGHAFGTSPAYDAFTAANQLPEVFVTLIAGGALAAAFIPVYSAYLTSDRAREGLRVANATLTLVFLILGSVSAIGAILAPWITSSILVPDFSPEQQALTAELMRIILLQTTLFGVSGVLSSYLNAHQHFILPALAPLALQFGYFFGLFVLVPTLGIHGLAWGTVLGGLLHILIQVPGMIRYHFRLRPTLGRHLPGVGEIVRLMGPRIVTLGAVQLADLFIIRLSSGLSAGSTSGYFYGYYLQQLPETLFGTAIAIVIFPTMAEHFNAGRIADLKHTAMKALRIIWWLTVPTAAGLILLGRPAITLFLQRGAFDADSTNLVYAVVIAFSLRVVSEASLEVLARLFYAQHNTRTPMFVALVWLAITVILLYSLVELLGVAGLALASSISFTIQSLLLYLLNRRKLGSLEERELLFSLGRAAIATAGMSLAIILVGQFIAAPLPLLVVGGGLGLFVYLLIQYLLRSEEVSDMLSLLRRSPETYQG